MVTVLIPVSFVTVSLYESGVHFAYKVCAAVIETVVEVVTCVLPFSEVNQPEKVYPDGAVGVGSALYVALYVTFMLVFAQVGADNKVLLYISFALELMLDNVTVKVFGVHFAYKVCAAVMVTLLEVVTCVLPFSAVNQPEKVYPSGLTVGVGSALYVELYVTVILVFAQVISETTVSSFTSMASVPMLDKVMV